VDLGQDCLSEVVDVHFYLDLVQLKPAASLRLFILLVDFLLLFLFDELANHLVEDDHELVPTVSDFVHHLGNYLQRYVHQVDHACCV